MGWPTEMKSSANELKKQELTAEQRSTKLEIRHDIPTSHGKRTARYNYLERP